MEWMLDLPVWLMGVLVVIVLVVAVGLVQRAQKRRTMALADAARTLGMGFEAEAPLLSDAALAALPLLGRGRRRSCRNVMRGTVSGIDARVFDFEYLSGVRGNNGRDDRRRQTVAAYHLAGKRLPAFAPSPERFYHRIASAAGFQDLDFDGRPDFSKRFLLRGEDEAAIRRLFDAPLLELFERQPSRAGWTVEAAGEWLIVYRANKRLRPTDVAAFVRETGDLAARLASRMR